MATLGKSSSREIVKELFQEAPQETSNRQPAVLSCGGIYIAKRAEQIRTTTKYHVLNLANPDESAKVVGDGAPRNILRQIMAKDRLN